MATRCKSLLAGLLLAGRAWGAEICDWATYADPVAEGDFVPTASWSVSPPCVSTTDLVRVAQLLVANGGGGTATNVQVLVTVDSGLVMVDASATGGGAVNWHAAPGAPVKLTLPTLAAGASVVLTLRVRHAEWVLLEQTPRANWAWSEFWPACEHTGSRFAAPGVLVRQLWARDLYWALEERCEAVHVQGSKAVYNSENPFYPSFDLRPSWWTEAGVTNRVVGYESQVMETAKTLARRLAVYYLDTEKVEPGDFAESWHNFHAANGGRADVATQTNAFTGWVWGCPGEAHSAVFVGTEQEQLGTNGFVWTWATLPAAEQLPKYLFYVNPARFLEGPCDISAYANRAQWVYRVSTITGACNWATFSAATVGGGPVPALAWSDTFGFAYPPQCVTNTVDQVRSARLAIKNTGSETSLLVRVELELNGSLEVVDASSATDAGRVQWAEAPGQPVVCLLPTLDPGETTWLTVRVRMRPEQGDGTWYWPEFGWDSVRKAIQRLDTMRVNLQADSESATTTNGIPVRAQWLWRAEEGENHFYARGNSTRTYWFTGTSPGSVLDDGSYDAAKDDAAAENVTLDELFGEPYHSYEARFFGEKTPPAGTTNDYSCFWTATWTGTRNRPAIDLLRRWPPTNVIMTAHFLADVVSQTAPEGQEEWTTEHLGSHIFSAPGTNDVRLADAVGDLEIDAAHVPSDPSSAKGLPILGEGEYPDDTPEGLEEWRGNYFLNSKRWEAFLILQYDWSLP